MLQNSQHTPALVYHLWLEPPVAYYSAVALVEVKLKEVMKNNSGFNQ